MSKIEYKQELPTKPGVYWNKEVTNLPTEHRLMHVINRNGILMASHYNEGGLLTLGCYGALWAGPVDMPSMPDRPDHIACIAHTHRGKLGFAWCGRYTAHEWTFVTIDHAAYTIQQQGRLVPCPQCLAVIQKLLQPQNNASPTS